MADFYDRALEIIEEREVKLPLKIYYGGKTIVRYNISLKLFNLNNEPQPFCRYLPILPTVEKPLFF